MRYVGGKILKDKRDALGLTLDDVSRQLAQIGVKASDATIWNWEQDKCQPDAGDLAGLAQILKLPLRVLYTNHETP